MRKKVVLIILFSLLAILLIELAIDIRWFCHEMSIVSIYAEAYSSTFSPNDFEQITVWMSTQYIKKYIVTMICDLLWLIALIVAIVKTVKYKSQKKD